MARVYADPLNAIMILLYPLACGIRNRSWMQQAAGFKCQDDYIDDEYQEDDGDGSGKEPVCPYRH